MENTEIPSPDSSDKVNTKLIMGTLWVVSLFFVGIIGFYFGQNTKPQTVQNDKEVLAELTSEPTLKSVEPTVTTSQDTTFSCEKTGYAQKWEYLLSYTIKENDSLKGIAEKELGNENRVNEILHLNGVGPLVVGSTLYLPPKIVTKSSEKLKQVHGKLKEKNGSMWHLGFSNEKDSMGVLIPTHWFGSILDKDNYSVGDCLTILFDDGNTVFSVSLQ